MASYTNIIWENDYNNIIDITMIIVINFVLDYNAIFAIVYSESILIDKSKIKT